MDSVPTSNVVNPSSKHASIDLLDVLIATGQQFEEAIDIAPGIGY